MDLVTFFLVLFLIYSKLKRKVTMTKRANQIKVIYCPVHKCLAGNENSGSLAKIFPKKPPVLHPGQNLPIRYKKVQQKAYHKQIGKKMGKW